ncbi:MAG: helicase C-terminal domain-containing protein [Actinomycetota bacterium]|nr:helicase C-terminal domain-containing protein [Actinomycetota bacterium]
MERPVYWRAVLQYCAWGNLEATLDEYLYHVSEPDRINGLTDEKLLGIASTVRTALTVRPSRYEAFDPMHSDRPIPFMSRFALRYGSKRATGNENARLPDVRVAFNSPFWPFVLATTSIGREGIDLHWWCHAAVHWNTPASPVDFQQREGRVHRYGGHPIRHNLANHHADAMRIAGAIGRHPWEAAYSARIASAVERFGDLAPHWITDARPRSNDTSSRTR